MQLYSLPVFLCLIFSLLPTLSTASITQQIAERAIAFKHYEHPEWLALLHYREGMMSSTKQSQADDPAFFVSGIGAQDPKAEMIASINALVLEKPDDQHFSCIFPARTRWLTNQLNIHKEQLPSVNCPKLEEFRQRLGAKRVNLIFAATYLNSPSSMFGHTFLRIDNTTEQDANLLLSFTVSYAADVQERDNELLFAYRGVFGGYPGVTSVVPYYEKLKQYIDMENRDIWEFELNLTQSEINQMVDHAWEVMDKNFDYYFFDENCAYRLLALIDVGRPGTGLIDDVSYQAIPSDTVRWVVGKELVANVTYRPSTSTTVKSQVSQLTDIEQSVMLNIALQATSIEDAIKDIDDDLSKARVLDAAYEFTRYDTVLSKRTREETAKLSHKLLLARSALGKQTAFESPPAPSVRDDQGHETFRIAARVGTEETEEYIELELRPAYHDLTDIPDGYPEGTQLRFLATRLRYWEDANDLDIEEVTLIDINSISPRDEFFKPTSWKIAVGAIRSELSKDRPLSAYLKGGSGNAFKLADGLLYGYLQGSLQSHRDIHKGYAVGPGLEFGWVRQKQQSQFLTSIDYEHFIEGQEEEKTTLKTQLGIRLDKNQQILGTFSRRKSDQTYTTDWSLEFRQYL